MIFVNFKTYKEGTGKRAVQLVHELCDCETESGVPVIPVVQLVDARACVEASDSEVWVQHVDGVEYGQHTGWILPEAVAEAGIKGTFLNHSEHKMANSKWQIANSRCQKARLQTLIFASDLEELKQIVEAKPTYVVYESPELIASPTTSVSRSKPEIITEAAKIAQKAGIPLIVGAGVKDVEDIKKSLELGAAGVAVSSSVVLAQDPKSVVLNLAKGFR